MMCFTGETAELTRWECAANTMVLEGEVDKLRNSPVAGVGAAIC